MSSGEQFDRFAMTSFANKPTTVAKRLASFFERGTHRPNVIGSEYRVSNKGKGGAHRAPSLVLLSLLRAKSLPGSAPKAPGRAVARDHALLPSRDGRCVARARRA